MCSPSSANYQGIFEYTVCSTLNSASSENECHTAITDDDDQPIPLVSSYSRWSPMDEGVTITWRDLYVHARVKRNGKTRYKRIINGVNGAVKAGSLVALMGASGSGKSTLMAALANRARGLDLEGEVCVNGHRLGNYMRRLSGFMHQDDAFVGSLTVLEHMNIMSHLKLDRSVSNEKRILKINKILRKLRLSDCCNTRIGFTGGNKVLSGGEKKRLAFATELLTDPALLFCDEPTTGLDASAAQEIVTLMNIMASSGKTVICTIHQPSSQVFSMFSQLILLTEGKIAFMGSTSNALQFFDELGYHCPSAYNPAEFFIKALAVVPGCEENCKQAIKDICGQFAVSEYAKQIEVVVQYEFHLGENEGYPGNKSLFNNYHSKPWWSKLYWLTYRWCINVFRNPAVQTLRLVNKMILALIIGACYFDTEVTTQNGVQAVQGIIFLFASENTFTPMYSVMSYFPEDEPLFLREYHSGLYPAWIYYFSKIIAMSPGFIIEPALFITVTYWMAGLKPTLYAFGVTTLVSIITMNISTACGILVSNAFESVSTAVAYLVPFEYIIIVTSGLFFNLSSLSDFVSWMKYFSWVMYSVETTSIVQWEGIQNITCDEPNKTITCLRTGTDVLRKYSFSEEHLIRDIWSMLIICIAFHVLAYVFLYLKTRK